MNCLIVINTMSGNVKKVKLPTLIGKYAAKDNVAVQYLVLPSDTYSVDGMQKLIVCGGDGTLNRAIDVCKDKTIDLYYLPCGTFNEKAKDDKTKGLVPLTRVGKIGDRCFSYVAAAGSFTDLGQAAAEEEKKKFKVFAYFAKVISAYRVHRIPAQIKTEKLSAGGVFTLLMISNATRCFGFRFNRLHRKQPCSLQLIAIRAPKKDNLWGRIKMFFPFFRVFFLGVGKERRGKNLLVTSFEKGELLLKEPTPFCLDGEREALSGALPVGIIRTRGKMFLIKE